jgi:drug/metabolite transporter (DMT)-like permease
MNLIVGWNRQFFFFVVPLQFSQVVGKWPWQKITARDSEFPFSILIILGLCNVAGSCSFIAFGSTVMLQQPLSPSCKTELSLCVMPIGFIILRMDVVLVMAIGNSNYKQ